jgi:1-acyl-sn-glycerol-3-phosphate acyltransferase
MVRIFKLIAFGFFALTTIIRIIPFARRIDGCRKSGDVAGEIKAIGAVEDYYGPMILKHFRVTLEAEGLENMPDEPALYVSNHQSYADIFAILAIMRGKQVGFIAKENLRKVPLYGKWIYRIRSLFLAREDAREAVKTFAEGEKWLKEGFSLAIFPEGTRAKSDDMAEFKQGSMRLATRTGAPVVPITIQGAWRIIEAQGYIVPGTIRLCVHEPIDTKDMSRKEAAELSPRVEGIIKTKLEEWKEK